MRAYGQQLEISHHDVSCFVMNIKVLMPKENNPEQSKKLPITTKAIPEVFLLLPEPSCSSEASSEPSSGASILTNKLEHMITDANARVKSSGGKDAMITIGLVQGW